MKRKTLLIFIAVLAMMLVMAIPAFGDTYEYEVNLDGGLYGEVEGDSDLFFSYGDTLDLSEYTVEVTNDKYYFKGFHKAGQEGVLLSSETITEDTVYVATFGVAGNQVAYTVQYVDEDGEELAESKTFYGDVGDQPVVAYLYIEGYEPQAYNVTKTLTEDESENVLVFTYHVVEPADGGTEIIEDEGEGGGQGGQGGQGGTTPGGTTPGGNTPGTTPGDNGDNGGNNGDNGGNNGDNGGNGETIDGNDTPTTRPDEIDNQDNIDDGDTPTDKGEGTDVIDDESSPVAGYIAGGAAAVVAALAALYFAVFRKKKDNE